MIIYTVHLYPSSQDLDCFTQMCNKLEALLVQVVCCQSVVFSKCLGVDEGYIFHSEWDDEAGMHDFMASEVYQSLWTQLESCLQESAKVCISQAQDAVKGKEKASFARLVNIMDLLREQCPWDQKQTLESLRNLTIEETYELVDAITGNNLSELKKELGDLMLHIVFYSKIATEMEAFTLVDVLDAICEKLIYRHPHIFSDTQVSSSKEVESNWEQLKLKEKGRDRSLLSGVPSALPALIKAYRIQDKARGVGFDWDEPSQVWDKVKEEIAELELELERGEQDKMHAEFGDVLFSLINAARLFDIDPEGALESTNRKFIQRFNYLEERTLKQGRSLKEMSLEEMEVIWQEAKGALLHSK